MFHIGSLSLTAEPVKRTTFEALEIAQQAGCIISYDPNYRAPLWNSKEAAIKGMRSVVSYVDVMKLSDEETALLTDVVEPEDVTLEEAAEFAKYGNAVASLCVEKRGAIPAMPSVDAIGERLSF